MKKLSWLMFCFILLISGLRSETFGQQKVTLCENYTSSGQPIGVNTEWTMSPTGGGVYILYSNNGIPISTSKLYVLIDQELYGKYQEYATESFAPDKTKSWAVFDYTFQDKGKFRVRIADEQMNMLAEKSIIIRYEGDKETSVSKEPKIIFCLGIDSDDNPKTVSENFTIDREAGSYIYIYIDNGNEAFGSEGLIVDIWKGPDYGDFVDTKNLTIKAQWIASYFKYTFTAEGQYKIMVYRKDNTHIATGYMKTTFK